MSSPCQCCEDEPATIEDLCQECHDAPACDACGEPCRSDEGLQSDSPRCEGCIDRARDFN